MHKNNSLTQIKKSDIIAAIVLCSCLNISYINSLLGTLASFFFPIRMIEIVLMAICLLSYRKRISPTFIVITIYILYLIVRTKQCGGDWVYSIRQLSLPYTAVIYMEWIRHKPNCINRLKVWKYLLRILILVDFATMILFPNGLYSSTMYSNNWFLGYKSARLPFIFAMLGIDTCIDITEKGNVSLSTWLFSLISCYELWKSDSMGAFAGVIVLFGGIVISSSLKENSKWNKVVYYLLNSKVFLPVYGVIVFLTVIVQNSRIILYVVQNIFHKDPTLTTRTMAWAAFVKLISKSPWFGYGYLPTEQYQYLSNNMYVTSAHNMVLSLLITGGIAGIAIYVLLIALSTAKHDRVYTRSEEICVWGILGFLLVGITSSAVVFSQFGFLFYSLLEINKTENMSRGRKICWD